MKSIGYLLLVALFGLVILPKPKLGEHQKLEIKEFQYVPQESYELRKSRQSLEETIKKVEANQQYLEHTIKEYGTTTQIPHTVSQPSN